MIEWPCTIVGVLLLIITISGGCRQQNRVNDQRAEQAMVSIDIRRDVHNMSRDQIQKYFEQCISQKRLFVYAGGVTGGPIVQDPSDRDVVRSLKTVLIELPEGMEQALYFNTLMIDYLKKTHYETSQGNRYRFLK